MISKLNLPSCSHDEHNKFALLKPKAQQSSVVNSAMQFACNKIIYNNITTK